MRVADHSLMDPAIQEDPYDYYRALLAQAPVYRMPDTGFYLISGYPELQHVLRHPEIWSNDLRRYTGSSMFQHPEAEALLERQGWPRDTKLQTDPPAHRDYRAIVAASFTAGRVKALEGFVGSVVDEATAALAERPRCEFIAGFAALLPIRVITKLLGLPAGDARRIKAWSDAWVEPLGYGLSRERELEVAQLGVELQQYLAQWMARKRAVPADDVLSDLEHATFPDGAPLPMAERMGMAEHVIVGGHETVTSALASGMMLLARHPGVEAELRRDRSLVRGFVEEVLRLESPSQGFFRYAVRDGEVGGVRIPKDAMVHVRFGAANRDPRVFADPDRIDLRRSNAGAHMAFGQGEHHCIGAPLARLELQTAFRALLERFDGFRLPPENTFEHLPGLSLRTLRALHVELLPRSDRSGPTEEEA
jgi:cytochrome P450